MNTKRLSRSNYFFTRLLKNTINVYYFDEHFKNN